MSRLRQRLARVLARDLTTADRTVKVDPDDLWPAVGYERTSRSVLNDSYRWSGRVMINGFPRVIDSYDTMTACAKRGVTIDADMEVHAKDGPTQKEADHAPNP